MDFMHFGKYASSFYNFFPIVLDSDDPAKIYEILLFQNDIIGANSVLTKYGVRALNKIPDTCSKSGKIITYNNFIPAFDVKVSDKLLIQTIYEMYEIQFFPDLIKELITEAGGRGIFYEGKLTDFPDFSHLKGKEDYDTCEGIYNPKLRKFIANPINYAGFHEYAHLVNDLIGKMIYSQSISEMNAVKNEILKNEGYKNNEKIDEFTTFLIEVFFSRRTIKNMNKYVLESKFPKTNEILEDLVDKTYKTYY